MNRTEWSIHLVVSTPSLTLADLAARIGIEPSRGSHTVGEPNVLRTRPPWDCTIFRLDPACAGTTPVEEQFDAIAERLPPARLLRPGVLPSDAQIHISVLVQSNAQFPTATLTPKCLAISQSYGAAIEVCLLGEPTASN
jgi:hypothetical protein